MHTDKRNEKIRLLSQVHFGSPGMSESLNSQGEVCISKSAVLNLFQGVLNEGLNKRLLQTIRNIRDFHHN